MIHIRKQSEKETEDNFTKYPQLKKTFNYKYKYIISSYFTH